ncbi:MAG: tyrosine-type recombinase/integrase [Methylocystis sp.]
MPAIDRRGAAASSLLRNQGDAAVKAIVKIPYVAWRDGRPRFVPGVKMRKEGEKGQDLRHDDGTWFTLREAEDWAREKAKAVAAARANKAAAPATGASAHLRKGRSPSAADAYTIEILFEDYFASKKFAQKAASTQKDYLNKKKALFDHDIHLASLPARDLDRAAAAALHEELWEARGLPMANGIIAVLRLSYSHAMRLGRLKIAANPCKELDLETPKPRLRVATAEEIAALMAVADALEPSVGDGILLALYTGQRLGDVLALADSGRDRQGRIALKQRKTGALVAIRPLARLSARLETIRGRRTEQAERAIKDGRPDRAPRAEGPLVIHPRTGAAWNSSNFTHRFAEVRGEAVKACASVADFRFQDLRDTAVTWLHHAGCDIPEIAAITGHSLKTVHEILKHYLALDSRSADRAMAKLEAFLEKEGVKV